MLSVMVGEPPGPPPGKVMGARMIGTVAGSKPDDASVSRAEHVPVVPAAFAVTVNVAGVVVPLSATETKLPHVESEIANVNGDAPAVLSTWSVWLRPGTAPPPPPGNCGNPPPPPPAVVNVNDAGAVTIAGLAATTSVTGTASGLLVVSAAEMLTVPL